MDLGEFILLLDKYYNIYVIILVANLLLFYFLCKKFIYNIFDPFLFFYFLTFTFSAADISFLYFIGSIKLIYFTHFYISQIMFLLGLSFFKPFKKQLVNNQIRNIKILKIDIKSKILFITSIILYILVQLTVYYFSGIPLLMESRWEAFAGGNGFGIMDRIMTSVRFFSIFFVVYYLLYKRNSLLFKFFLIILFIIIILFSFLSGSKMAILDIVYVAFFVNLITYKVGIDRKIIANKSKKFFLVMFFLALIGAIISSFIHSYVNIAIRNNISINEATKIINPIMGLVLRFIFNGDIYIMSYPYDSIIHLQHDNPMIALFGNVLAALRIISWKDKIQDIGFQIFYYHNPTVDVLRGPTTHFDIFGLFNFGYVLSLYFSIIIGLLVGFLYFWLFKKVKNIFHGAIYSVFAYTSLLLPLNPAAALSKLLDLIIFVPFLILLINIISKFSRRKNFDET